MSSEEAQKVLAAFLKYGARVPARHEKAQAYLRAIVPGPLRVTASDT